jgi:hypothetical protein
MKPDSIPTQPETNIPDATTEQNEVKREFTLQRGSEKVVVRNADEARHALYDGYILKGYSGWDEIEDTFGIKISEINREIKKQKLKEKFSENINRELLYFSEGLDKWFEATNNYRYHFNEYRCKMNESGLTKLEIELLEIINKSRSLILHQDPKDFGGMVFSLSAFNNEVKKDSRIPKQFLFDVDSFVDMSYEMTYRNSGEILWNDKKIPDRLLPKDKSVREYNPLLEPFRKILMQLKDEGVTELPIWLKQQGEMAGLSAAYQNISPQLNEWIKNAEKIRSAYELFVRENNIENTPFSDILPVPYAENLAIIDKEIHRR